MSTSRSKSKRSGTTSTRRRLLNQLLAGAAKVDITPEEPVWLGGYSLRNSPSTGVHGRLYVRALVFDDGRRRFGIMMADLIGIHYEAVRTRIARAAGIEEDFLLVGDVHNHAGPISRPLPRGAEKNRPTNQRTAWYKHYQRAVARVVTAAIRDLQPVKLGGAVGRSRIAMNRRKRLTGGTSTRTFDENWASQSFGEHKTANPVTITEMPGVIRLGANPAGPIDDEVGVLRIDKLDGGPLAVLMNYACHGTSLGGRNATVCGDWIGEALSVVGETTGAEPIFLQGAAGDINPRVVGGLDGHADSLDKTAELGREFAREAVRVHEGIRTAEPEDGTIRRAAMDIVLPRGYRELYADFRQTTVTASTTAVRIGDFLWVNFPGELFHEIGLKVKHASPAKQTFLASCTNGSIGYFPTRAAFAEGGYEPSFCRLDPTAEDHYLRQIGELMQKLR